MPRNRRDRRHASGKKPAPNRARRQAEATSAAPVARWQAVPVPAAPAVVVTGRQTLTPAEILAFDEVAAANTSALDRLGNAR